MIEVKNVSKKYKRKQVLKDMSFTAEKGQTKEEIVIYRYNIGQQRWLEPITVPYSEKVLIPELNSTTSLKGKFYVMTEVNNDFVLKIFDIEQGTLLYEGKLINHNMKQKYYIHITDVYELEK
ncbi:hypothetical protein [Solibacillus isronensis]|uniref:hypothetical protein n=1 Tax=Solibacillus isronensis TaxID=412383 RepID=UPI0009A8E7C1|nr:hypothetical protein [Solibacillus isronensis]